MAQKLLIDEIQEVVREYKVGKISYDECRERLTPIVARANEAGRAIAKKHGMKHYNFSLAGLMR